MQASPTRPPKDPQEAPDRWQDRGVSELVACAHMLTTDGALEEMASGNPYRDYHALEVAMRALFRKYSGDLPAHYTSRDFLTFCFDQKLIDQDGKAFVVKKRTVDLEPDQVQ